MAEPMPPRPKRRECWVVYDYPGGPVCFSTTDRSRIKDRPPQEIVHMVELGPEERIIGEEDRPCAQRGEVCS